MTINNVRSVTVVIPVYNKETHLERCILSIASQELMTTTSLCIVAVNDNSTDNSLHRLKEMKAKFPILEIVNLKNNNGRSYACNTGARHKPADLYIFIDADCYWTDSKTIGMFIHHFQSGILACSGITSSNSDDFWGRFYNDLSRERNADVQSATTACFACKHNLFTKSGGFSEAYSHYGFEDRDLIIRLQELSNKEEIIVDPEIVAENNDKASIDEIFMKMKNSGRHTAPVFRSRYINQYREMKYAKVDLTLKGQITKFAYRILRPLFLLLNWTLRCAFKSNLFPYVALRKLVHACSALSYLDGTYLSLKDQEANGLSHQLDTHP